MSHCLIKSCVLAMSPLVDPSSLVIGNVLVGSYKMMGEAPMRESQMNKIGAMKMMMNMPKP